MPCHSQAEDQEDALLLVEQLDLSYQVVVLDTVFDQFLLALAAAPHTDKNMARANIKPRLRMIALYYYAACFSYRVMGPATEADQRRYFTRNAGTAGLF